ncbi:hypothetical protein GCM10023191_085810 [Actinoallomurus oryzae]|jgi:DNA-binding protein YbaB|uniref:Uncharacterized protein n=1 Tax=Actinoallomurus oryzae TaxID=502180 RepID=A0ABP8R1M4_9ACTN
MAGRSRTDTGDAPANGHGESKGGIVRVTVAADGLVESVELAPKARRLDAHIIADHFKQAMRAAQLDRAKQLEDARQATDAEEKALEKKLAEINDEYTRQLEACDRMMHDIVRAMGD